MGFFDDLTKMDPYYAGGMDCSPMAKGAYFGYMDKSERINDVVDRICAGETSLDVDDDFTKSDIATIKKMVEKRTGEKCNIY